MLPVLTYTRAAGRRRRAALAGLDAGPGPRARRRARTWTARRFPWRTIRGQECSAYWPAGTAALHVNADIAARVRALPRRHRRRLARGATAAWSCSSRRRGCGCRSATTTAHGVWHLDGRHRPGRVHRDRARQRLHQPDGRAQPARSPPRPASGIPRRRDALGVTTEETAAWRDAADDGAHPLRRGARRARAVRRASPRCAEWDFDGQHRRYPLLLHEPYVGSTRTQVIKQADLVLAMHWQGHAFTPEQKARNVDYYERAHGARLVAVGVHPGGACAPRSGTWSSPTTTPTRPR